MSRFQVIVTDMDTARDAGSPVAVIDDARDIGASKYANAPGEFFMTLPWNHPQIDAITPLQTHYWVRRRDKSGVNQVVFRGIIDDFDATKDEVVFYGRDYLSLLDTTITQNGTSYSSQFVGTIISDQLTAARAETNSRVGFIGMGTIDTTSVTTTVISNYQSRLSFISSLADIVMSNTSARAIISVTTDTANVSTFVFNAASGTDQSTLLLAYGGLVNDFRYVPGYADLVTTIKAIGQKREGASVLYSSQSYAASSTYGYIARPEVFLDVTDQAALDRLALRSARRASRVGKSISLVLRVNGLGPGEGYGIGDSLPVSIQRGIVSTYAYYTVWGYEWIGRKNGSEDLFLSVLPKDT